MHGGLGGRPCRRTKAHQNSQNRGQRSAHSG
jgi:hypothetical protein